MDARLLDYYNQELRYLREAGAEFAEEFPKIASRLGMSGLEVADPYVERLLEGMAFLAARVQIKLDAEFPRFSERLLEQLYPNLLAPLPAMLVLEVRPKPGDANLLMAPRIPRNTVLHTATGATLAHNCEFRTRQEVQLSPLTVQAVDYLLNVGELGLNLERFSVRPRSAVRLRLSVPDGVRLDQLNLETLRGFIGGTAKLPIQLYELITGSCVGVLARASEDRTGGTVLPADALQCVGYDDDDAMLPIDPRGQSGLRLLLEYFAFPERFRFVDLCGLRPVLGGLTGSRLDLVILCSRSDPALAGQLDTEHFRLHCAPAINLFPMRGDPVQVDDGLTEFHVVPKRTAPLDFEVFSVDHVTGIDRNGGERPFTPLFAAHPDGLSRQPAYFALRREPRLASERMRRDGPRSGYVGSEVFMSIIDLEEVPHAHDLQHLSVQLQCTNRDLSLFINSANGLQGASLLADAQIDALQLAAGPSRPASAQREGGAAWRLINLITLNYLSLVNTEGGEAAAALRALLFQLPFTNSDPGRRRQIEALQGVNAHAVVRRHPVPGPVAFTRGIAIELVVDALGFEGASTHLFGAALHHFLSRQVSINSFVESTLSTLTEPAQRVWQPLLGRRPSC